MTQDSGKGERTPAPATGGRRHRVRRVAIVAAVLAVLLAAAVFEARTSTFQSLYFSRRAAGIGYRTAPGASDSTCFPAAGPLDVRRGYTRIPDLEEKLVAAGFQVREQARVSPRFLELCRQGIYPIYDEKPRAGLVLLGAAGETLSVSLFPKRVYADFDSIPPLVRDALLYIENRELLRSDLPYRNPAVEWDRLAKAGLDLAIGMVDRNHPQPGGSTLATQIEKFRHSPGGLTAGPRDKLLQMLSASYRAYRDGRDTRRARRRIVLEYVNGVPLAAVPGYGEVIGVGDGLWAWYGEDVDRVNRLLAPGNPSGASWSDRGTAFKRVLSLFVAQRRPSQYLIGDRAWLEKETDVYLRILARDGVISPELRDASLAVPLAFRTAPLVDPKASFVEHKAANAIRVRLLGFLGLNQLYALDRYDLRAETTLRADVQRRVAEVLQRLRDRDEAARLSLTGFRLLDRGDPAGVITSFTLYEATPVENLLRVQADNWNQPLDVNEGTKLDLGSTAKLRTLVTYLEAVAELHAAHAGASRDTLRRAAELAPDRIRRWGLEFLAGSPDTTLDAMLAAALDRTYSGDPDEAFFTGGGRHTFANFTKDEDHRIFTVREGLQQSVNLVFVRLMRDLVRYYVAEIPGYDPSMFTDSSHPLRHDYLVRFADKEGKDFLAKYYPDYQGKSADECLSLVASRVRQEPRRLSVVFRSMRPEAPPESLAAFLGRRLPGRLLSPGQVEKYYRDYSPDAYPLHDRAYLAGLHPLELWVAGHLQNTPGATWREAVAASEGARQEAYAWLFSTRSLDKQNQRIRIMVEEDAFQFILRDWRRLGYPFDAIVPSYATAIGSSADRPAALAELMGILVNDGVRKPIRRLGDLEFAAGTPFETVFGPGPARGERVLPAAVARAARRALIDVVEGGTAVRVKGAFRRPDGSVIPVGGKTGTGDHRYDTYNRRGLLIDSRVVNRAATFVFLIGDRYYGTVTAYVPGKGAAAYDFTSSLPVQLLASLAPDLLPLVGDAGDPFPPDAPDTLRAEPAKADSGPAG